MELWTNLDRIDLEELAETVGGLQPKISAEWKLRDGRNRFRLTLELTGRTPRDQRLSAKYQRRGHGTNAAGLAPRISAVCWHGYRDWMLALFGADPAARLKTAQADYRGRDGFLKKYPPTGRTNIGSTFEPLLYEDACDCTNHDIRTNHEED